MWKQEINQKKKEKVEEFRGVWSRAVVPLAHKLSLGLFYVGETVQ